MGASPARPPPAPAPPPRAPPPAQPPPSPPPGRLPIYEGFASRVAPGQGVLAEIVQVRSRTKKKGSVLRHSAASSEKNKKKRSGALRAQRQRRCALRPPD